MREHAPDRSEALIMGRYRLGHGPVVASGTSQVSGELSSSDVRSAVSRTSV